jgi:excisionase family DNA binding protein
VPKPEPEEPKVNKLTDNGEEEPVTIFTVSEPAEYLKTGKSFIYNLAQKGEIGHVRVGRRYLFPKQDDWLMKNSVRKID